LIKKLLNRAAAVVVVIVANDISHDPTTTTVSVNVNIYGKLKQNNSKQQHFCIISATVASQNQQ
jgi:hypothetical protein